MSAVFARYPNGGGEMLLALALADHAADDGARIFPTIDQLALKTRQSRRTVQYQLREMEAAGWLVMVNRGNGGRGVHTEYRIAPDWINGAEIAPIQPAQKGATDDIKGAIHSTKGATSDAKGAIAVAPASNHHNHQQPSSTIKREKSETVALSDLIAEGCDRQHAKDWLAARGKKPLTLTAWGAVRREAAKAGISVAAAVTFAAEKSWQGFNAGWYATATAGRPGAMSQADKRRSSVDDFLALGEPHEAH